MKTNESTRVLSDVSEAEKPFSTIKKWDSLAVDSLLQRTKFTYITEYFNRKNVAINRSEIR